MSIPSAGSPRVPSRLRPRISAQIPRNQPHWLAAEKLPLDKWSNVKVTHGDKRLKIFIDNKLVCVNDNYAQPDPDRKGTIKVYGGNPWNNVAKATVKNVKYSKGVSKKDHAALLPYTLLKKSQLLKTITTYKHYSMTFKIFPLRKVAGTSSILHFTAGPNAGTGSRIPAIWFHGGSTKLHVRQGSPSSWNDGCDPGTPLPLSKWSEIKLTLVGHKFTVYINGKEACSSRNYWKSDPGREKVKVYAGDPWHVASSARIKNFEYEKVDAPKKTDWIQKPEFKLKKNYMFHGAWSTYKEYTYRI